MKTTLKTFLVATIVSMPLVAALPAQDAHAQQATKTSKSASNVKLIRLLSAYHELPSEDLFAKASATPEQDLITIAKDTTVFKAHRYRALEALAAYWPSKHTVALFDGLFASVDEQDLMLHQLLTISSKHLDKTLATSWATPYLSSTDEQVRYTAVDALGRINTPASKSAIKKALETETNNWVKEHMKQMLIEIR